MKPEGLSPNITFVKGKIVYVLEPYIGGTREHFRQILTHLHKGNFEITFVVSPNRDLSLVDEILSFEKVGVKVRLVPMRRRISPLSDFLVLWKLRRVLKEESPDILHTSSSKSGFLGRLAGRRYSKFVIHTPHIFAFEWNRGIKRRIYRFLESILVRRTDFFIAIASYQKRYYPEALGIDPERIVYIPNGVEVERFCSMPPRQTARERLGLDPVDFGIASAGRFCPQKDFDNLIKSAAKVRQVWSEAKFLLFGEGELEADLYRLASGLSLGESFRFMGQSSDLLEVYPALDAFVLSSRWEGMPYVIIEAMCAGVPVVSTDLPGVRDLIEDGVTGLLAPPQDPEALAEKILKLRDPDVRTQIADNARRRVRSQFTSTHSVGRLQSLYIRLLSTE